MRFCPTCGTERVARFCAGCGFDFEATAEELVVEGSQDSDALEPSSGELLEEESQTMTSASEESDDKSEFTQKAPIESVHQEPSMDLESGFESGLVDELDDAGRDETALASGVEVEEQSVEINLTDEEPQEPSEADLSLGTAEVVESDSDLNVEQLQQKSPKPSGWYSDPINAERLRYWDGSAWTDKIAQRVVEDRDSEQPHAQKSIADLPTPVILEGLTYGAKYRAGSSCFNCGFTPEERTNFCEVCGADLKPRQ